jgi:hypothetical protein
LPHCSPSFELKKSWDSQPYKWLHTCGLSQTLKEHLSLLWVVVQLYGKYHA